ncbi:MAG: membrane-bound lytic murein transglycosylase MltF [Gammaproteobacteria bacterium]|nr:membrane-bound lytic murein transglycosylase MltF [Gammaproteobacteria bacterium]
MPSTLKPAIAKTLAAGTIIVISAMLLTGYVPHPTALNLIRQSGELVIATRNSPTTYYEAQDGTETGFEYDLAKMFADELGVKLHVVASDDLNSIISMVARKEADIAAAGLIITDERSQRVRFSTPYQTLSQYIVYRSGTKAPRSIDDLSSGITEVVGGSSHAEKLRAMAASNPALNWNENFDADIEELLTKVSDQEIDYTIANSIDFRLNQRYYPELRAAFELSRSEQIAWAIRRSGDDSLREALADFFSRIKENGQLDRLYEKHFGHIQDFDYAGTLSFNAHVERRLPNYAKHFQVASRKVSIDWRLLAAMGYQESHWDPLATSRTGVRGIMMLTRKTAEDLGVKDRVDPMSSIYGGARYFDMILDSIPHDIADPDRTWLALAAYNIGLGHLEDARKLTQARGGNPDAWADVKETLPLLMQRRWYMKTKHGYARGREAVHYVENVRDYYDMLVWKSENGRVITASQHVVATLATR